MNRLRKFVYATMLLTLLFGNPVVDKAIVIVNGPVDDPIIGHH